MTIQKKSTHGGAGRGQGAKKKYGEETVTVNFKAPASKVEELKEKVREILKTWVVEK